MLLLKCLPLILLGSISSIIALVVLQRGYKKVSNFAFASLALAVGGWVLGIAAFLLTNESDLALIWAKVYYFFPLLIGLGMLCFAYLFPNKKQIPKGIFIVAVVSFLGLAVPLFLSQNFLTSGLTYHSWGKEILLNKNHYFFYSLFVCATFLEALRVFYVKSKKLTGLYKAQASLLFTGLIASAILGVLFNLILPGLGNYKLIHLGPLATNFFLITIAYSIIRHRMFDLRLIIVRSAAYALALGFIAVLYGVISYLLSNAAFEASQGTQFKSVLNIALLILVAITFSPVKRLFDKVTNKIFYRDSYDSQELLDELNQVLVASTDMKPLLEKSAAIITKHLKTEFCLFGLKETAYTKQRIFGTSEVHFPQSDIQEVRSLTVRMHKVVISADDLAPSQEKLRGIMQKHNIAVMSRLTPAVDLDFEGIGYILLGYKKSGNPYNKEDLKIMEIISNELVIAIQNALRFEEIEQFNVTLQEKVDMATKKLQRANDKLTTLDETKDEFISMASHQLRTPLTSVKGYISMVLEGDAGELNDMQRKLLDQSFASSQRMVYLIADLLNLSRLRTGKFVIENKPTNLADVIESEVEQLKASAAGRDLTLTYEKPKTFPTLMMDETKMRQVVMNFSDNAIYYTPAGGNIDIKLRETKDSVEFTVNDDGIGIPVAEQHKLFGKFYRAKNAQKARPDGTGLGLFMAKKVIIGQGGAIVFKSKEGKGSTFGFTFSKSKLKVPAHLESAPEK